MNEGWQWCSGMVEHREQQVNPYDPPHSLPERTRIQWKKGSIASLPLSWFPLPALALIQIYFYVTGHFDPVRDDQMPVGILPLYFFCIGVHILIATAANSVTIYRFFAVPNGPKASRLSMEVTLSWTAQFLVWMAYGVIGTWLRLR